MKTPKSKFADVDKPLFSVLGPPFRFEYIYEKLSSKKLRGKPWATIEKERKIFQKRLAKSDELRIKYLVVILGIGATLQQYFDNMHFGDPIPRKEIRRYLHTNNHPALLEIEDLADKSQSEDARIAWMTLLKDALEVFNAHWLETVATSQMKTISEKL